MRNCRTADSSLGFPLTCTMDTGSALIARACITGVSPITTQATSLLDIQTRSPAIGVYLPRGQVKDPHQSTLTSVNGPASLSFLQRHASSRRTQKRHCIPSLPQACFNAQKKSTGIRTHHRTWRTPDLQPVWSAAFPAPCPRVWSRSPAWRSV